MSLGLFGTHEGLWGLLYRCLTAAFLFPQAFYLVENLPEAARPRSDYRFRIGRADIGYS